MTEGYGLYRGSTRPKAGFQIASKMSWLQLKGVTRRFGKAEVLSGIDLSLGDDEMLVVLGPTGAGKTTLLRIVAGLDAPDAGQVEMDGEEVTHWPPADRDIAFVFQHFALYPDWSVRRNLEFPLKAPRRQMASREIAQRVGWAAELLKIERLLDRSAARLSGGEMQRVAIGQAIVRRPRLFLFDEPLTNLDAKLRESLRLELALLRQELGIPAIYVTHDQAEALSMGDSIAVLAEGRILQQGSPEAIYRQPVSPVVARQLGQPAINILSVQRRGDAWIGPNEAERMPARNGTGEMLLGVRPEDIAPAGGQVPGVVRVVEDAGAAWILWVDWAGTSIHIIAAKERRFAPGETVYPRIDAERALLWPR